MEPHGINTSIQRISVLFGFPFKVVMRVAMTFDKSWLLISFRCLNPRSKVDALKENQFDGVG